MAPLEHRVQRDVFDFFRATGLVIGDTPALRRPQVNADLILEEARETAEAITGRPVYIEFGDGEPEREQSLAGAIDGLCDLLATIYGAAITFGVDLAPFWDEVHRTNMAKAGGPKREDGKLLKPEGWQPPDIVGLLAKLYPNVCRICGCTPVRACWHDDFGGCGLAAPGLCTACTPDAGEGWERFPPDLQDFGPREDEDGEGLKPADPSDGAAASIHTGVDQKPAPDAGEQEGAKSSRVGGPSDKAAG